MTNYRDYNTQIKTIHMKTLKQLFAFTLIFTFAVACKNNDAKPEVKTVDTETTEVNKELDPNAKYAKAEFNVEGMTCAVGCAATIEKKLAKMDGVKSARVDFEKELAWVEYDEAKVTTDDLEATVKKTGDSYTVKNMKTVEEFKTDENSQKENADKKAEAKKETACKADCKMACCAKEAKA